MSVKYRTFLYILVLFAVKPSIYELSGQPLINNKVLEIIKLGSLERILFLCICTCLYISVLRVASGPRVKASFKGALNPPLVYSTDRSKAVVPVLSLALCYFVLVFFNPFSIAITSLVEERANLSAFRTFVRFALVWFCLFPLPLGIWEGLRLVIVALLDFSLTF